MALRRHTVATLSCGCRAKVWRDPETGFWSGKIQRTEEHDLCDRTHFFLCRLLDAWLDNENGKHARRLSCSQ